MTHPLLDDVSDLSLEELEKKISNLTQKYFMTQNLAVRAQMVMVLDTLREELSIKQQAALDKFTDPYKKDLDKLINIA